MAEAPIYDCQTSDLGLADKISCYCERGLDPALWAEPANALSNLAFIAAALVAGRRLRQVSPLDSARTLWGFIALLAAIGVGSFLFHTTATVWGRIADVVPIGLFVFAYMALALNWFVGLSGPLSLLVALGVTVATFLMPPWLNGSLFYAPALLMLVLLGALLTAQGAAAGKAIAAAAALFLVALVARTLDRSELVCGAGGLGSHWAWHSINAVMLYLLLSAAIAHASRRAENALKAQASGARV